MVRFGRWFIALFMVVMLAGLVPPANADAQVVVRVGPHRRYHHPHHYRHHRRRWHR